MPRKYIKKHKKSYTTEDLAAAKDEVKAGNVSRYTVAKKYNIPVQHYMTI